MPATIDLRSDTVTRPTPAMRAAMARAEVGDDAYGDDPTVRALEERVAAALGHSSAVLVPSGTMANQLAVGLHARPGETLACCPGAHVQIHEDASAAALSGVQIMPVGDRRGFDVAALEALLAEEDCGWPPCRLVWLEQTLGVAGGIVWPIEGLEQVAAFARARNRTVHLDGARLWNAHVATGVPLARLAATGDTVSVALSKGLGAPAGSVLCGSAELIERARRRRHALGGTMRQAGILAAAGLFALDHNLDRLADDHRRARELAHAIADLPVWEVEPPQTNIVIARVRSHVDSAERLCAPLRGAGLLCYPNIHREVRFALHLGIDDAALADAIARIREVIAGITS